MSCMPHCNNRGLVNIDPDATVDCSWCASSWMQTASGRRFWPLNPVADEVYIEDIAHALSHVCRFGGHTKHFYSVAQHSYLVSVACDPADALWGLLHDASEAYIGDVIQPLKRQSEWRTYKAIEERLMAVICERFGLPTEMPASVKRADLVVLATEKRDLMSPAAGDWGELPAPMAERLSFWWPDWSREVFMKRFRVLTGT